MKKNCYTFFLATYWSHSDRVWTPNPKLIEKNLGFGGQTLSEWLQCVTRRTVQQRFSQMFVQYENKHDSLSRFLSLFRLLHKFNLEAFRGLSSQLSNITHLNLHGCHDEKGCTMNFPNLKSSFITFDHLTSYICNKQAELRKFCRL